MNISDFDYDLPDDRIAKFPEDQRDASKLLVYKDGDISEAHFRDIADFLPPGSTLVFNNTRVVRARLIMCKSAVGAMPITSGENDDLHFPPVRHALMQKPATQGAGTQAGARIELLCLEPHEPADYERAFAARGHCEWVCMVGNLKKWGGTPQAGGGRRTQACELSPPPGVAAGCLLRKESDISDRTKEPGTVISCGDGELTLRAFRKHPEQQGAEQIVRFEWSSGLTFGEMLEHLGRVPIPPYLGRDSAQIDLERYQTVYSRFEGSVAAPTAGLHFTPGLIAELQSQNIDIEEVTLHVGAGTFLPVKVENALDHPMHIEHFEVTLATVERLLARMNPRDSVQPETTPGGGMNSPPAGSGPHSHGKIIAVGTTSVRTLESLPVLAWRIFRAQNLNDTESYLSSEADKFCADCKFEGEDSTERTNSAEKQGGVKDSRLSRQIPVGQFEWHEIPDSFTGAQALQILAEYMRANGLQKLSAATQIMITPGFRFRLVSGIVTNFHQPKSTLLLLVSAFVGGENRSQNEGENGNPKDDQNIAKNPENWRRIYDYALSHDFRFLSYGDSSLLLK